MSTIQEKAEEFYGYFQKFTREGDDRKYWKLADDAPEELRDLVREAHGDMFPDDWRYQFIVSALGDFSDDEDPDYPEADVYTSDRLAWLASHLDRLGYVDDIVKEIGHAESIVDDIGNGQAEEMREVFDIVRAKLEDLTDD